MDLDCREKAEDRLHKPQVRNKRRVKRGRWMRGSRLARKTDTIHKTHEIQAERMTDEYKHKGWNGKKGTD